MSGHVDQQVERRNEAAKVALRIVRKFPQIEQAVLVPMLIREIGAALLQQQDKVALHCADVALRLAAGPTRMAHRNGCHDVNVAILQEFGLSRSTPESDTKVTEHCTSHRSFNGCELAYGHKGEHKAGGLTWE